MAQVNFIRETLAFHRYAKAQSVTGNERHLWWALLFLFNDAASCSDWPDGFLSFSNKQLLAELPYSEDSLSDARRKLAKRGIIEYKPGRKNTLCPRYKMIYLTASDAPCGQPVEKVPEYAGNSQGNNKGNIAATIRGNSTNITLNPYGNPDNSHTDSCYDSAWRTSERVRAAVAQRILNRWGGDCSGGFDIHGDLVYYLSQGMTPETIERVLSDCGHAAYVDKHLETEAIDLGLIVDPNGYKYERYESAGI